MNKNSSRETILNFIAEFSLHGNRQQVIECFTQGYCYWFAYILQGRFIEFFRDTAIMYDDIANHFGCLIDGRIYDITGDVTDKYNWKLWYEAYLEDPLRGERIERDCVYKLPIEEQGAFLILYKKYNIIKV